MKALTDVFFTVIKMDGYGVLASLVVMLTLLVFSRARASKTALLALWLVVGIRLVCPWTPASSMSLFNLGAAKRAAQYGTWGIGRLEDALVGDVHAGVQFGDGVHPEYDEAVAAGAKPVFNDKIQMPVAYYYEDESGGITPALTFRERYGGTAAVIWLAGVAAGVGYGVISCLLLKRRLRFAVRDETAPVLRVRGRAAGVWLSDRIPSPCVMGLLRPRIYLSFGMSEEEKIYVLAHERQHVLNFDPLWKILGWLVLCVHWFNPVIWAVYRVFLWTVEEACDQRVLRELGEEQKADYGQALLSLSSPKRFRPGFSPLAFGEGETKERIKAVLKYKKPLSWITAAAVVLCAVAGASVLTQAKSKEAVQEELAGLTPVQETVHFNFHPRHGWDLDTVKRSGGFPFRFDTVFGCDRLEISCENSEIWSFQDLNCTGPAIYTKHFSASLPCSVNWCPIPGGDYKGRFGGTVTSDTLRFSLYYGEETVLKGIVLIQAEELDWYGGGPFTATAYLSDNDNFYFTDCSWYSGGAIISGAREAAITPEAVPKNSALWVMPAGGGSSGEAGGFRILCNFNDDVEWFEAECKNGALSLYDRDGKRISQGKHHVSLASNYGELYWTPINGGSQTDVDMLTFNVRREGSVWSVGTLETRKLRETGEGTMYQIMASEWFASNRYSLTMDSGQTGAVLTGGPLPLSEAARYSGR